METVLSLAILLVMFSSVASAQVAPRKLALLFGISNVRERQKYTVGVVGLEL